MRTTNTYSSSSSISFVGFTDSTILYSCSSSSQLCHSKFSHNAISISDIQFINHLELQLRSSAYLMFRLSIFWSIRFDGFGWLSRVRRPGIGLNELQNELLEIFDCQSAGRCLYGRAAEWCLGTVAMRVRSIGDGVHRYDRLHHVNELLNISQCEGVRWW
jgi:hypothetical protein